ncbi:hypothetical protein Ahy_B04g071936 [Arachis hypogaea]|uniref:Replication protein A 70 kDa DNA-binding subunit B/D first OB fold domain-containing protein n=1 Tax=Arachis hypogaea TaxID=3818 RepID=A0A444ZM07_ARAHY|nr:hypothetical protein Ahy_B04g071936 [Arachis hypogaea]
MAGIHKIAEINPTIDNLYIRIRVIRLWTLPNYRNSSLSYSIEIVWLDEDGGKIHASVKRAFVSRFGNFKTTHHEYVVNLNQHTDVHKLSESSSIPRYGFNFVSFDTLNVVGYLARIESERILEKDGKSTKYTHRKIMRCALFGNHAHELNTFLKSDNKDGAVVVLQFVRVKLYNEKFILQNFMYDTKMFFNLEEANVIQFKNSFVKFEEPRGNIGGISNETAFLKIYQGKTIEQYRIKLGVIDNSDCACFVKGDQSDTPTFFLNLIEKTFLFIVEVQISDNPHFSPFYKVKNINDNVDLINKFKKAHSIQIMSTIITDVDYIGGLLPTSKASSIIKGEKIEGAKLRTMINSSVKKCYYTNQTTIFGVERFKSERRYLNLQEDQD